MLIAQTYILQTKKNEKNFHYLISKMFQISDVLIQGDFNSPGVAGAVLKSPPLIID